MYFIRPVREDDLDRLLELASSIEGGGMTTLPPDRAILERKVKASVTNFAADIKEPGRETYMLVLEDATSGKVFGTAAAFARIGLEKAFYTYALTKNTHVSVELKKHTTHETLHLVNDYIGFAEVGSLYVDPSYRSANVGRTLARSRYLLMGEHRERFAGDVVAEMRGWQEDGVSPFWEAVGKYFFDMTFHDADHLSAISNNQFIADLMPRYPIYVDILPKSAQSVIGKVHKDAAPALKLLEWEGFRYQRHVDIFDAGPCVQARVDDIKAVRDAKVEKLVGTVPDVEAGDDPAFRLDLLSTGRGPAFRATSGLVKEVDEGVILTQGVADMLSLTSGDTLRHTALR